MPRFSTVSVTRLETCHPDLSILFTEAVKHRDCSILCGVRSQAEQDRLYNLRHSRVAWPNSKHNVTEPDGLSMAVDVAPWFADRDPHIIWPSQAQYRQYYAAECGVYYNFAGYVQSLADRMGIRVRWGGDWDSDGRYSDQTFNDLVHWELL